MRIKFWLNGSGGFREENKIINLPDNYSDEEIRYELEDWRKSLFCSSEYVRYGWENINETDLDKIN